MEPQPQPIEGYRLSPQQEALWEMAAAGGPESYRTWCLLGARGRLDRRRLRVALDRLMERHEILRTAFTGVPGWRLPLQVVTEGTRPPLPVVDFQAVGVSAAAAALVAWARRPPFDLEHGEVFSAALGRTSAGDHLLGLSLPALCCDRHGLRILVRELIACYAGSLLADEPLQYLDVAGWQHELAAEVGVAEPAEAFWRRLGPPEPDGGALPVFEPRPGAGATELREPATLVLQPTATAAVSAAAARHQASWQELLGACWAVLLWRLSDGPQVALRFAFDGRRFAELGPVVGLLARHLPVRCEVSAGLPFATLLSRLRDAVAEAGRWQEHFRWRFVADGAAAWERFPVGVDCVPEMGAVEGADLTWTLEREDAVVDRLVLRLTARPCRGKLCLEVHCDGHGFHAFDAARMARWLDVLVAAAARHPERPVAALGMLSAAERQAVLVEHNDRRRPHSGPGSLPELLRAQAIRTPHAVALVSATGALTYGQLDARARRLTHELRRLGVGPDTLVAVYAGRGQPLVVAVLAVLAAGGAYVPLDAGQPRRRLAAIIEDCAPPVVLAEESLAAALPESGARLVGLGAALAAAGEREEAPLAAPPPEALAYVLYTSGSTGRPKGVMVPHRGVVSYLAWCVEAYGISAGWGGGSILHSPLAFDLSVTSLFAPLLAGDSVELVSDDGGLEGLALALARRPRLSLLKLTPAHLGVLARMLADDGVVLALGCLVVGGEALHGESVAPWGEVAPGCRVVNEYGPTEASVGCAVHAMPCAEVPPGPVPIGGPTGNARLYVLDERLEPLPSGMPGALWIAGDGLARGYLRRPGRTADCWLPDPLGGEPGGRLYRSGDVVRRRADGGLEFLHRADDQVKVRGFRIEPGEIEAALRQHPAVAEAAVQRVTREGEAYLVGYFVATSRPSPVDLRRFLAERLPEFMLPAALVPLPALPLTPHGKLDRSRLPEPPLAAAPLGAAEEGRPRTPAEELVAGVWAEVLQRERVGIHDDFLALGGHSLLVIQIVSRLRRMFGVELPLRTVFAARTVARLTQRVEEARQGRSGTAAPPVEPAPPGAERPLSFAQQRLWFFEQLHPGSALFNVPAAVRLTGTLEVAGLAGAFSTVARRHQVLRTSFVADRGQPRQVISPPLPLPLPVVDLGGLREAAARPEAQRLAQRGAARPFDLARAPLWRVCLLRLGTREHLLVSVIHHIASDAWSMGILVSEVATAYGALVAGRPPILPELAVSYADFAVWQRSWLSGAVLDEQVAYWRRRLGGELPLLELPADRPRPEMPSYRGGLRTVALSATVSDGLRALSRRAGTTVFMTLLAAFKVLLRHATGLDDVVVGTDVAGRNREETEGLIGFFINQLVLRTDLTGNPTFDELLERVREGTLEAYAHQDLPFERLLDAVHLERSLKYAPLFQVKFLFENTPAQPAAVELPGLRLTPVEIDAGVAKNDFTLALGENPGGEIAGWINYSSDLFDGPTIAHLWQRFERLAAAVVASPDARLTDFDRQLTELAVEQKNMEKSQRRPFNLEALKTIQPEAVTLPAGEVVKMGPLELGSGLPWVIEPAMAGVDLIDWIVEQRPLLDERLAVHGALLFRGFGIDSVAPFERFAGSVCSGLFSDNTEHPRESVSGNVYTPVFYPPDKRLLMHNENSFNLRWPLKILFCCAEPAQQGGETPLADSRQLYARLDPEIRRAFEAHGVMYMRNYFKGGLGLPWQQVFGTTDRAEVESYCRDNGMQLHWRPGDRLQTMAVRPATVRHPRTGEASWFNQAQHWHISCLEPELRRSLESLYPPDDLPRHCFFGDGSAIPDAMMAEILRLYDELQVAFPWRRGDVLLVDNVLAAHGRNPFIGERKILVSMGELTCFADLERRSEEE